jgi:aspartyl-tRNA(Asn)/glutamyl-tRNA(Gln) amidotransferase subunit C
MEIADLQETASLAHIQLDEKELNSTLAAFEQMLGFFAAMQAADADSQAFAAPIAASAEGMAASSRMVKAVYFRQDALSSGERHEGNLAEAMLAQAGERDGRFLVIPNVL